MALHVESGLLYKAIFGSVDLALGSASSTGESMAQEDRSSSIVVLSLYPHYFLVRSEPRDAPVDRSTSASSRPLGNIQVEIQVPFVLVEAVEKVGAVNTPSLPYGFFIQLKDFRRFEFHYQPTLVASHPRRRVFDLLCRFSFPNRFVRLGRSASKSSVKDSGGRKSIPHVSYLLSLYASGYLEMPECAPKEEGWDQQLEEEFRRLGLDQSAIWRISRVNADYELCPTYPSSFMTVRSLSDQDLVTCAKFRTKSRLPVLCWCQPRTGVSLTRSSQPKPGMTSRRSEMDERLLDGIRQSSLSPVAKHELFIMDARPKQNAMANQAAGAGYENVEYYPHCQLEFMNIENIHVMRDSFKKLKRLCQSFLPRHEYLYPATVVVARNEASAPNQNNRLDFNMERIVHSQENARFQEDFWAWQEQLDASKWLYHVQRILVAAARIVRLIYFEHTHVLVHCTDGWDRTPMLVSLAQIMLDPYYRTRLGFRRLVGREWLAMGHQFRRRLGLGVAESDHDQMSPTFLQFLDAVYQLVRQFPDSFEFGSAWLVHLMDLVWAGRSLEVVVDSQHESVLALQALDVAPETYAGLWGLMKDEDLSEEEVVPNSREARNPQMTVLLPALGLGHIVLWTDMYCRWDPFYALRKKSL